MVEWAGSTTLFCHPDLFLSEINNININNNLSLSRIISNYNFIKLFINSVTPYRTNGLDY